MEDLTACLLTLRAKREFLAAIVRAAPGDLDEKSPLVQFFKQTEAGREIRLCDKLRAIELDAKLAGEFSERWKLNRMGCSICSPQFRRAVMRTHGAQAAFSTACDKMLPFKALVGH